MLAPEVSKSHDNRLSNGFYSKYMNGRGVDFGFRGSEILAQPVLKNCIGVELGTPGYNSVTLDAPDGHFDFVFSSHVFEHLPNPTLNLKDWYRLVKVGGFIVIIVPHRDLYEKRLTLPSRWNEDHRAFYTPSSLLAVVEVALRPNSYRVVHCRDNDDYFDYSLIPEIHSAGCYEIELVLCRITLPIWDVV